MAVVVAIAAVAALLVAVFVLGIEVFLVAFAGVLVAVFLRALAALLTSFLPLSDRWALTLILLLVLAVIGVGGWLLAPQISAQVDEVGEQLPGMIEELRAMLGRHEWGRWILSQLQDGEMPDGMAATVGGFFSSAALWFTYVLTLLFVGLFGAYNPQLYRNGLVGLFPLPQRPRAGEVIDEIADTLRWWLIGRAVAMLMVGVTTGVVLGLLGMPFALLLGVLAGLLTFIPYLGPIAAGVPIILFALLQGPEMALYALIAYTGVQVVEGYVLDPLIMQRLVYIPPILTLVLQVLMAVLLGALGIAMATPLAAVLVVLTRFYRTDILGEPQEEG